MLTRGTKIKSNEVNHLPDGTTRIVAIHKGQSMEIMIDTTDWPMLEPYSWYVEKAKKTYYAITQTGACSGGKQGRGKRLHTILCPGAPQVDHIDRNGLNNKRSNLRAATVSQNNMNRGKRSNTSSPYIGVSWSADRQKWQAGIKIDGKRIALGRFNSAEEAALVRDAAAISLFKDRAALNFSLQLVQSYIDTMEYLKK
jgi:hypothetical protein